MTRLLKLRFTNRYFAYIAVVAIFFAIVLVAELLDAFLPQFLGYITVVVKFLLAITVFILLRQEGSALFSRCRKRYFLFAVIYAALGLTMSLNANARQASPTLLIHPVLSVLSTVLLEELLFRVTSYRLFSKDIKNVSGIIKL